MTSAVLQRVIDIAAKQLDKDPAAFNASTDLQEAGFESLDVIEMVFNLEDEFKIDIPLNANETDTTRMRTVGDVAGIIETLIASKPVT